MNRPYTMLCLIFSWITCAGLALVCFGAPMVPGHKGLPDAVISLAHLKEVRLEITPVSQVLVELDVTDDLIRSKLEEILQEMGIAIVEDKDTPILEIMTIGVAEPAIADGLAFNMRLLLHQHIYIERLEQHLTVPTFSDFNVSLDRNDNIRNTAILTLDHLLTRFKHMVGRASRTVPSA